MALRDGPAGPKGDLPERHYIEEQRGPDLRKVGAVAGGTGVLRRTDLGSEAMRDATSPIADYAIIGCTRSAALISRGGSIDWLCWPRFDSPSIFARLLDVEQRRLLRHPSGVAVHAATRRYLDDTNVIETTFTTDGGTARLLDLMPVMTRGGEADARSRRSGSCCGASKCIDGEVPIEVVYAPRPDYARVTPRLAQRGDLRSTASGARSVLHLRSDAQFVIDDGHRDRALHAAARRVAHVRARVRRSHAGGPPVASATKPIERIDRHDRFWRDWSSQLDVRRPVSRAGPAQRAGAEAADVRAVRRHRRRADDVAPRVDRRRAQLGLSLLLAARCVVDRRARFSTAASTTKAAAFLDWLLYSHAPHAAASADALRRLRRGAACRRTS